jgi:hypothetical protein
LVSGKLVRLSNVLWNNTLVPSALSASTAVQQEESDGGWGDTRVVTPVSRSRT